MKFTICTFLLNNEKSILCCALKNAKKAPMNPENLKTKNNIRVTIIASYDNLKNTLVLLKMTVFSLF